MRLTLTVAIGLITFFVASIDRGIESRRRDAPLLAIGVPARTLRLAEATQLLVVIFTGFALGLVMLVLTTRSWAAVFHMPFDLVVKQLLPLFGSVIAGMVLLMLAVVAVTTRRRSFAPQDLRRE